MAAQSEPIRNHQFLVYPAQSNQRKYLMASNRDEYIHSHEWIPDHWRSKQTNKVSATTTETYNHMTYAIDTHLYEMLK